MNGWHDASGGSDGPDPGGPDRTRPAAGVAAFRFWRRVLIAGILAFFPLAAAGTRVGLKFPRGGLPAVVVFALGAAGTHWFCCPRCGRTFHRTAWWQNVFTNHCLHCGYSIRTD